MLERTQAVTAIRAYGDELRRLRREPVTGANGASERRLSDVDEREAFAQAFNRACSGIGVSADEVRAALAADPSLRELEDAVAREALVGAADPGPYDAISRESPSGSTKNQHLGAYGAAAVGEKVTE